MNRILPVAALAAILFSTCPVSAEPIIQLPQVTASLAGHLTAVSHAGYSAAVDDTALVPRWVAYRLSGEVVAGCTKRRDNFHVEEQVAANHRATPGDYAGSGYDKGHLAPAEDFALDATEMSDSFSMANMTPQLPGLNRAEWEHLEETVRAWALARGELILYVGPVIPPHPQVIGPDHVAVPVAFWKVIVDPAQHAALAFMMPQQTIPKGDLKPWETTIAEVEKTAAIKLPLPDGIDAEARPALWPASIKGYRDQHKRSCALTQ